MPQLPTEIRRLLDHVRRQVRQKNLWQPGDRVLLACSGGRDSQAALGILQALRPSLGHTLIVAHVDHGLQPNHGETADLVRQTAANRQLQHEQRTLKLKPGPNLEGRARTARYRALQQMAKTLEATVIVTAHHADDQAETLLMRLARGAGLEAQAGIRLAPQNLVRPFLHLTRADLALAAQYFQLPWLEDPSNQQLDFTRNRLRHTVLPALEQAMPQANRGLARSAELAAEHEGALGIFIHLALTPHVQLNLPERTAILPQHALPDHPPARAAFLHWLCGQLQIPPPTARATQEWLRLTPHGQANLHRLTVTGNGRDWLFFASDVARDLPAD